MVKNNIKTKFHFNEKVKILNGFYRTHTGIIKSVKTFLLDKPKYVVQISYDNAFEMEKAAAVQQQTYTLTGNLNVYSGISGALTPAAYYPTQQITHTLEIEVREIDLCHADFNKKLDGIVNGD